VSGPSAKDTVTATAYLVVRGERNNWQPKSLVWSAKVAGVRAKKPTSLGPDDVIVKIKVELPKRAFEPLEPEALIVVPEELVQHVVTVEATEE
jgi:hypothetical protein